MRVLRVVGVVALLATVGAACGTSGQDAGSPGTSTGGSAPSEQCTAERVGGSAAMAVYSEIQGLDPLGPADKAANGGSELAALFDTLIMWDSATGGWKPQVAQSLEPDPSLTRWTLKLRPGIKFGNGDPLTTAAVRWTIELHQSDKNKQTTKSLATMIKGIEVVDDLTMVLTLGQAWGDFPYVLSSDIGMVVNPAVYSSMTPEQFALNPNGGGVGAYEVERYAPGDQLLLKAKSSYWGGPVCIQQLKFVAIKGAGPTYDAFKKGEVQVAFVREPLVIERAREDGVNSFSNYHNLGEMLLFNAKAGPLADVRLRQAVVAALDPQMINQRANEGAAPASSAVISPQDKLLDPGVPGPATDPALARRLVDEVKAQTGWDGTVKFVCDNAPVRVETAIAAEAQLEAVGFKVDLQNAHPVGDTVKQVTADRNFDLACWGLAPAQNLWPTFDRYFRSDSSGNLGGFADPAVDKALDELRLAANPDAVRTALGHLQEAWNRSVPSAVLWAAEEFVAIAPQLKGIEMDRTTIVRFEHAFLQK